MMENNFKVESISISSYDKLIKKAINSMELDSTPFGESMRPLINDSSKLKLKYFSPAMLVVGDVIAFEGYGSIALHRIVGKKFYEGKIFFLTKGDNQFFFDELIDSEKVIGKLVDLNGNKLNEFPFSFLNKFIAFFSFIQGMFSEFFLRSLSKNKYFSRENSLWKKIFRTVALRTTNPLLFLHSKQ